MTGTQLLWTAIKILVMVGFVVNIGALLTWYDRRGGAMMQDRIGPNRAGLKIGKFELRIAGLLHTAADGLKFFTKKDFMPPKADKLLFSLAPILALFPVIALTAVIPFGETIVPDSIGNSTGLNTKGVVCPPPSPPCELTNSSNAATSFDSSHQVLISRISGALRNPLARRSRPGTLGL